MRVLITAGNTRERIDDVRDWGNIFSGNTGFGIAKALAQVAACARLWRDGDEPADVPRVADVLPRLSQKRDVFLLFISAAKEKAPAAAMGVIECLG